MTNIVEDINEFDDYVNSVREDWSDFDGRTLLSNWKKLKEKLVKG